VLARLGSFRPAHLGASVLLRPDPVPWEWGRLALASPEPSRPELLRRLAALLGSARSAPVRWTLGLPELGRPELGRSEPARLEPAQLAPARLVLIRLVLVRLVSARWVLARW
jgi:hypothetical protein